MPEYKSIGVRLEGTEPQLIEGVRRLKQVFTLAVSNKLYQSQFNPDTKAQYFRAYCYPDSDQCLLEQLEAAHRRNQELEEIIGEQELEIERLMQKLGELRSPEKFDVVLGVNNGVIS